MHIETVTWFYVIHIETVTWFYVMHIETVTWFYVMHIETVTWFYATVNSYLVLNILFFMMQTGTLLRRSWGTFSMGIYLSLKGVVQKFSGGFTPWSPSCLHSTVRNSYGAHRTSNEGDQFTPCSLTVFRQTVCYNHVLFIFLTLGKLIAFAGLFHPHHKRDIP